MQKQFYAEFENLKSDKSVSARRHTDQTITHAENVAAAIINAALLNSPLNKAFHSADRYDREFGYSLLIVFVMGKSVDNRSAFY